MDKLQEMKKLLADGRIGRREFLRWLSIMGLATVVSPAVLKSSAVAAAPKKGGRLRLAISGGATTDSLDPATLADNMPHAINWQIRNNLVEIDHMGNPIPELAESWEAESGAAKWVFKLRQGVEFHNGKSLDAEDVVYSINHHRGEGTKSGAKAIVKTIDNVQADGKSTVIFTLKSGNADFPYVLTDYHLTISPAGTEGEEWEKGIGTGGYILERFEPGVSAFAKRNPNYWKSDRAHFDEVETIGILDFNARTTALKTRQADVINKCDLKTAHLLKRTPGVQMINATGYRHLTAPMLTDISPLDNNDVRLALKYAVDREHLVSTILRGYGSVGNDHPISPTMRFHAADLPQRQYDPDKARYHMKKAGLAGHTFDLYAAETIGGGIDAAVLMKEYAAKAGIDINVVSETSDGYWKRIWMKKSWCMSYWGGRPTEDMMFSTGYAGDANWNDSHWKNERFDTLLTQARSELDSTKRKEMYAEMQRLVRDEGGVVVFAFTDHVDAASDKIKHSEVAGNWQLDGMRCAERWWFA